MLVNKILKNENLLKAEFALKQANSGNIISLCLSYLALLADYRDDLYKLRGAAEINQHQSTSAARELTDRTRKSIRAAVEFTTGERNQTESLLKSFTSNQRLRSGQNI